MAWRRRRASGVRGNPAELVELAEAEVVGVVDDDGVDVGHIDAVLYDCSRQEHVIVSGGEVADGLFEFLGGHLSVSHHHPEVGDEAGELRL